MRAKAIELISAQDVQAPAVTKPTDEQFYTVRNVYKQLFQYLLKAKRKQGPDKSKPDVAFLKNHFYRCVPVHGII